MDTMAAEKVLKCTVNHAGCTGIAKYVCHHCGRLICDGRNCLHWGWDPALAGWPVTYHCRDCDNLHSSIKVARNLVDASNQLYDGITGAVRFLWKRPPPKNGKQSSTNKETENEGKSRKNDGTAS
jgi:hypothetical protein